MEFLVKKEAELTNLGNPQPIHTERNEKAFLRRADKACGTFHTDVRLMATPGSWCFHLDSRDTVSPIHSSSNDPRHFRGHGAATITGPKCEGLGAERFQRNCGALKAGTQTMGPQPLTPPVMGSAPRTLALSRVVAPSMAQQGLAW